VSLEEKEGTKMKRLILMAMVFLMSSSMALAQNFCQGDFTYDGDVDANDVTTFLEHFGRSIFSNPCPFDGPSPVAKTRQTTSYHEGDDGGRQKGVEWPVPRFIDEGDGAIYDKLTGLIWLKNANCFGPRDWYQALTDCNVLANGQCGLTDGSSGGQWRLPNKFELESLRDMRYWEPALSNSAGTGQWTLGDPFTNLKTSYLDSYYWSSTTYTRIPLNAWTMEMHETGGFVFSKFGNNFYVWPVRGGH
jgi:hypothetical protein